MKGYKDADGAVSVPAFVVPASQIIQNMGGLPRVRGTPAPAVSFVAGTGSNRLPLGSRTNKRTGTEAMDLLSPSPKRTKTEGPTSSLLSKPPPTGIIDLTQDDEPTKYIPTRRQPTRPALANISNNAGRPKKKKKKVAQHQLITRESIVQRETTGVLAKIASKLRASAHALDVDRDTLRQRWEIDGNLQLQQVTKYLAELNECFTKAENGIKDALMVIEDRLLR